MSWITPIKNTFIKFIVKGKGNGGGGGIDEETLNAKLAQFYATTETKILNLVNQKLADYVLQTAFNELEAKVNTNTTNITNLEAKVDKITIESGTKLSKIYGYVKLQDSEIPKSFSNLTLIYTTYPSELILNNDQQTIINISDLKKYIISWNYAFEIGATQPTLTGIVIKNADNSQFFSLGESTITGLEAYYLTNETKPVTVTWTNPPKFTVEMILSDTIENITNAISNKSMKLNMVALKEKPTVLNVTSWKNIG